ncbi:MAG: valine--tRNA ligase [Bacteroidota bacterium]
MSAQLNENEELSTNAIAKAYSPRNVEDKWYTYWEEYDLFHARVNPQKKPYTVVIPPPNITGSLTMGHVLNNTIQDIIIRWKRMQGFEACWIPGTDHAGIATQHVVEKQLVKEGQNRRDIGREKFLKRVWEWKEQYGGTIIKQLRKLGTSCDWNRERFTMDDGLSNAVVEVFIRLYEKDLIYRGKYIVNWCPKDRTALSDDEVNYSESQGHLWYIRYPFWDETTGSPSTRQFITVATTRPETMLGDTAIAVNPSDERYSQYIGKKVLIPMTDRCIPVIADDFVDQKFGTGMVKVTPAHDPNDYTIGIRHNLPMILIMDTAGRMNDQVPQRYQKLDRYECRKKLLMDLDEAGLILKTEDYVHSIGHCYRCDTVIEPYLSDQWFVKMKPLAEKALKVVQDGTIRFYPDRWLKVFEYWMTNIRDWCISRQLWWGHRIPVYYCIGEGCQHMIVARTMPTTPCPKCGTVSYQQDDDVLDTWFSSWLWPFSILNWPQKSEDLDYFYPTSTLVTAPDIIFFWVARMIMAGLEFMDDIPFRDVYFTSIIRDVKGRKMSKSLGNSPDPLDVIQEYGADALRFTIIYLAPLGQDVLYSNEKCEIGRNFANKIWNAGRFLLMNVEQLGREEIPENDPSSITRELDLADRWILSRYHQTVRTMTLALDGFSLNESAKNIYDFLWHDFCDWYVELIKTRLYESRDPVVKKVVLSRALWIYGQTLKLLHPLMPFLTEELWHALHQRIKGDSIMRQTWPEHDDSWIDERSSREMTFIQDVIGALRNIRGEMNIPPARTIDVVIKCSETEKIDILKNNEDYFRRLAKVTSLMVGPDVLKPSYAATAVVAGCEIFLPLKGIIDINVEMNRLEKEIARVKNLLRMTDEKLQNKSFVDRAPAEIIAKENEKKHNFRQTLEKLNANLTELLGSR